MNLVTVRSMDIRKNMKNKKLCIMEVCSWVWKGILKHRKNVRKLIKYTIVNSESLKLWYDLQCREKPLIENEFTRKNLHINFKANVSQLLYNGAWNKLFLNLPSSHLRHYILSVHINQYLNKDEVIWCSTPPGEFSNNSAYRALSIEGC